MVCQVEVHLLNFDEAVWVGGVRCFPTRLEIRFANSSANPSNALRDFVNIVSPFEINVCSVFTKWKNATNLPEVVLGSQTNNNHTEVSTFILLKRLDFQGCLIFSAYFHAFL